MQALLDQVLHSDCTRQRNALSSIGYRAQLAGTTPIAFLRAYFYAEFQANPLASPTEPAAPVETSPVKCGSCGKTFATQTALNGHGEARCQARLQRQPR
ncbi:C2H2-type zinc finger protein [uncultured Spirosoma sp.]|uniref:C2H2-type zinc finger protein n=1 Tax=uncultured Spirosoma sp. TaxID=278208 RepID=UPI0025908450|nr:C2H2-type zinc finger protein [uncultured Spirosoma sp.]